MNYLAHALLASESPEVMVGGLMGDFVKGRVPPDLPASIRHGIVMHRRIDTFTDTHELVLASKRLVSPGRRRFAGIMVDVFFDHFLARHWQRYSCNSLPQFTSDVYRILYRHWLVLPTRLRRILPFMAGEDWLASYCDIQAIHASIDGISLRRLRRENSLYQGANELERRYSEFEQHFFQFFPQLVDFVQVQDNIDRSSTG